jgi:hypothetical protein
MDLSEKLQKNNFLENLKHNRNARLNKQENEERRQNGAVLIQRIWRGYTTRRKFHDEIK